jgi:DNA-binding NarL/FixJ family response regulator
VADTLRRHPAIDVVGCAGDAGSAARLAGETRPDVVLLDLLMPGAEPDVIVLSVAAAAPGARIAVFSGRDLDALSTSARAAVSAHFEKTMPLETLAARVADLGSV